VQSLACCFWPVAGCTKTLPIRLNSVCWFFRSLDGHVLTWHYAVIVDCTLCRKKKPIITLGLSELKLMIEELWKNMASSGRHVGIMKGCMVLMLFMSGFCPSSIAAGNSEAASNTGGEG